MFDPTAWSWPQFTILALLFLSVVLHAAQNGKPMGSYSFPLRSCRAVLWLFLLTFGGFFSA